MSTASAKPFYQTNLQTQIAPSDNCYIKVDAFGTTQIHHKHLESAGNPLQ